MTALYRANLSALLLDTEWAKSTDTIILNNKCNTILRHIVSLQYYYTFIIVSINFKIFEVHILQDECWNIFPDAQVYWRKLW